MTSSDSSVLRELAQKLGAMETLTINQPLTSKQQPFDYLIVLDFEATCWDTKLTRKTQNEIIEFAAVLLHIPIKKIISTFKEYVKPTENPTLTAFCTSLTGIQQSTVDNAETIDIVLDDFDLWIKHHQRSNGLQFASINQKQQGPGKCTFATWSDWDLGTCLKNECKRKRLERNAYFNQWIDVRKTYIDFYKDRPIGLIGALHSLKMEFSGQEHSGIDDARNTAHLINRMVDDGVRLAITKSI